ncbi:MAG: 2-amino-4-hydroxy-6-hydroxymethyldihydropteridine diphosphokinase [Sandarakinorhabdus sp.]|nr:2-amino-4-hydroxy-6-hydroxymethyldihydropteridine diphosphokinase [Sandarakinorhabdus sp.]
MTPVMIGLGSNRCHGRHGRPEGVLRAAVATLEAAGLRVDALSPVLRTAPLGPSKRRFANAALRGAWAGSAAELLTMLKQAERDFGRRRGQRWGQRVLDCDLLAFGQDMVRAIGLEVPHPRLHMRHFVLGPMLAVWPDWRHPILRLTVRQLAARLAKARAMVDSGG